jgi:hypothetical protein
VETAKNRRHDYRSDDGLNVEKGIQIRLWYCVGTITQGTMARNSPASLCRLLQGLNPVLGVALVRRVAEPDV